MNDEKLNNPMSRRGFISGVPLIGPEEFLRKKYPRVPIHHIPERCMYKLVAA